MKNAPRGGGDGGKAGSNTAQNRFSNSIAKQAGLDPDQANQLHRALQQYDYEDEPLTYGKALDIANQIKNGTY